MIIKVFKYYFHQFAHLGRKNSILLVLTGLIFTSCASYEQFKHMSEEFEIPYKVFRATQDQAWQAVLQVMQHYELEMKNYEAGVIKTRWIDNTLELNFADSFGRSDAVKAAKFRLIINVVKGFSSKQEVSKVTVFKRQLVQEDFLHGWREIPTDGITEHTILYRINRIIKIDNKLKQIEKKENQRLESDL